MRNIVAAATGLVLMASGAQASTTIVNLNASATSPNAGNSSSSTYPYNPVNLALAAGTYSVRVVGLAGGGMYDAYAVYAPSATNGAYTDSNYSVSLDGGQTAAYNQANIGRFNTAAAAETAYSPYSYTFTLARAQSVAFYVDDTAYPYFQDDIGGVSLAVSSVPEPAAVGMFLVGIAGLAYGLRRRSGGGHMA